MTVDRRENETILVEEDNTIYELDRECLEKRGQQEKDEDR